PAAGPYAIASGPSPPRRHARAPGRASSCHPGNVLQQQVPAGKEDRRSKADDVGPPPQRLIKVVLKRTQRLMHASSLAWPLPTAQRNMGLILHIAPPALTCSYGK